MKNKDDGKGVVGLSIEELNFITETTMDWIAVVDSAGRIQFVNNSIRKDVKGVAVGQLFSDLIIESDRPQFEKAITGRKIKQIIHVESGFRCHDKVRYFALRIVPIRPNGELNSFFIVGYDVTAERLAAEELKLREKTLQKAEQLGGLASWRWDIKNDVGYWSDNFYRMAGHAPQSFVPRYELFMSIVHPDDRAQLVEAAEAIYRRDASILEKPFEFEYRLVAPDGKITHVLGRGEAICDSSGTPVQTIGTLVDITERRRSEAVLRESERNLVEAQELGKIGSWDFNLETGKLSWSKELYRITGIDASSTPLSEAAFDKLFKPADRSLLSLLLKSAKSARPDSDSSELSREVQLICPNKSERTVFERARIVFGANQRPQRIQGIIQDITEIKRMQVELRALNESLKKESEMLEGRKVALKEVLGQIKDETDEIRQQISHNVERLVRPSIAKLRSTLGEHNRAQLDALESTIIEIASPFVSEIERRFVNLTPREMQICYHIRSGLRSKEIAELLTISVQTVEKFRQKIRKKLAIEGTTVNLATYLRSVKSK